MLTMRVQKHVIIDLAIPGDGIVSGTVMDGDTFVANSQFTIQNTANIGIIIKFQLMIMVNFQLIFQMETMLLIL